MSGDSSVSEYLEEILESGRTPEDVCAARPELLDEVRRRLRNFKSVEAQIEDLFPSSSDAILHIERSRMRDARTEMPKIPGYELVCVLGYGGMGVVYKARHIKLKRPVAVKMLLSGVYASPIERTRFLREAEAVARLSHPNVVQVHDMGEFEGRPYFTMELVEGETLSRKLNGSPWPVDRAVNLMKILAQAVQAAHEAGIVHRDLKPGNILISKEGTPKVSDFGLARRVDDDINVTLSGARVGTPCYMAPEQALGHSSRVGPATDVYALGAILYELITGRPPFRGESTTETERQLIHQEPVPPRRLNAKIPRDLDTICLKCLRKEPHRRYSTATALAQDLGRFSRKEPIAARRTGVFERSHKWVLRHPAFSVGAVAVFLLAILLISASVRSAIQQAELADAIDGNLHAMTVLQNHDRWDEAQEELGRAEAILGTNAPGLLRLRCQQAATDLGLARELDRIRLSRVTGGNLMVYRDLADQQYAAAFARANLGRYNDSPRVVAARISASAVRPELVAALDDWALCAGDSAERNWILEILRIADPDPLGWNEKILNPATWSDAATLMKMADSVPVEKVSVPLLLALSERLTLNSKQSDQYLLRVQHQHPDDFWLNMALGNALLGPSPAEAREFYRAALAVRPDAPVGYCAVGDTLREEHRYDEAYTYYQKTIQLDPTYARGYCNIGLNYQKQGNLRKAIEYYHKSLTLDPKYAWSYYNLGTAFDGEGQTDAAIDAFRKAEALEPNNAYVLGAVREIETRRHPGDYGWLAWHEKVAANPPSFDDWWGYPELTLFLGKIDDYQWARQTLLKQFGDSTDPMITEKIGRACLMLPGTPEQTRIASTLIQRAVDAPDVDPDLRPYFIFAQGLAEYRQGNWQSAIDIMRHTDPVGLDPCPQLMLAMALYQSGDHNAALKTLARAVVSFDWRASHATKRDIWFTHILRREAEGLILPNARAMIDGAIKPRDNDERLALLGICEFNALHLTEAQLLSDAFDADPKLPDEMPGDLRFRAARAAVTASESQGSDSRDLDEAARTAWRDRAIAWLEADLSRLAALIDTQPVSRSMVIRNLRRWQQIHELAPIHDNAAIQKLPAAQRAECSALWSKVAGTLDRAQAEAGPDADEQDGQ